METLMKLTLGLCALIFVAAMPATAGTLDAAIAACVTEADMPHRIIDRKRTSRSDVREHQRRMRTLCQAWRTVANPDRDALREECRREAAGVTQGIRRTVKYPDHVAALHGHCETLWAATNAAPERSGIPKKD
jgi:hypothetical protein